jgi:hypothetical protein
MNCKYALKGRPIQNVGMLENVRCRIGNVG